MGKAGKRNKDRNIVECGANLAAFLLATCLLAAALSHVSVSAARGATSSVDLVLIPKSDHVGIRDRFEVQIEMRANGQPVMAVAAFVDFDPSVLQVVSVESNPQVFPVSILEEYDNGAGTIDFSAGDLTPPYPADTATLATIVFSAEKATDSAALAFHAGEYRETDVDYEGQSVLNDLIGAQIRIVSEFVRKAVIVAGGSGPNDPMKDCTNMSAALAYQVLLDKGYRKDRIYLICAENMDVDDNGFYDERNATATLANVQDVFDADEGWAKDAGSLIVYLVDHGGQETFRINGDDYDILEADILDDWLDALQKKNTEEVLFVYDACKSGSFLEPLKPPFGKKRVIVTSTNPAEFAYFLYECKLSFSYQFWTSFYFSSKVLNAFVTASDIMMHNQSVQLEADFEDGGTNDKQDFMIAGNTHIGLEFEIGTTRPALKKITEYLELNGETSASFSVALRGSLDPVEEVWATVEGPEMGYWPAGRPVVDSSPVDRIDLDNFGGGDIYGGTYDGFTQRGLYLLNVYAMDSNGLISLPVQIEAIQTIGEDPPAEDANCDFSIDLTDIDLMLKIVVGQDVSDQIECAYPRSKPVGLREAAKAAREAARTR